MSSRTMALLGEYETNAWGRRVVRDYRRSMPAPMRCWFVVVHFINKLAIPLSLGFSLGGMAVGLFVIHGTWLVGGSRLLSDSPGLVPMAGCVAATVAFLWVFPAAANLSFNLWYEHARKSWLGGPAK